MKNITEQRIIESRNALDKFLKVENKVQSRVDNNSEVNNIYGQPLVIEFNTAIKTYLEEELAGVTKELHRAPAFKTLRGLVAGFSEVLVIDGKKVKQVHPVEVISGLIAYHIVNGFSSDRKYNKIIHTITRDCWLSLKFPSFEFEGVVKDSWVAFITKVIHIVLFDKVGAITTKKEDVNYNPQLLIIATPEYLSRIESEVLTMTAGLTVFNPLITKPSRHTDLLTSSSYQTFSAPLLKHVKKVNGNIHPSVLETTRKNFPQLFANIDKIQETAYCVNKSLLSLLNSWYEDGKVFGKFHIDPTSKELNDFINEQAQQDYELAVEKRTVYAEKNDVEYVAPTVAYSAYKLWDTYSSIINDTQRTLAQAEEYSKYEEFFYGVHFDSRGRIYYYNNCSFQPQGNELGKALIQFANKEAVTEAGLSEIFYNLGNVLGMDKCNADVRINSGKEFFYNHIEEFMNGEYDVFINQQDLFEEPLTALSYCIELTEIHKDPSYKTGIVLHRDARCSGIAINGMLQRDLEAAELTSCVDAFGEDGKLKDAYQKCANILRDMIKKECDNSEEAKLCWKYKDVVLTRKSCKHHVMIIGNYCGSLVGAFERIQEQVATTPEFTQEAVTYLGKKVMKAVEMVSESASTSSLFFKELAEKASNIHGGLCYRNTSGFPVVGVEYKVDKNNQVKVTLPGKKIIMITCTKTTDKIDLSSCKSVASPNTVHSLDSNLVMSVREGFNRDLITIHDSFGCHPNHVAEMKSVYNKALHTIATTDVLGAIAAQANVDIKVPTMNTMTTEQIKSILTAEYSLC